MQYFVFQLTERLTKLIASSNMSYFIIPDYGTQSICVSTKGGKRVLFSISVCNLHKCIHAQYLRVSVQPFLYARALRIPNNFHIWEFCNAAVDSLPELKLCFNAVVGKALLTSSACRGHSGQEDEIIK